MTPKWVLSVYHFCFAYIAAIRYGFPSKKMLVIGITGTKGKTSSCYYLWSTLTAAGIKTGMLTTAAIKIGSVEKVNTMHMSMPGRFFLQKTLREMYDAGCEAVIVETTSQGIAQHRHRGIDYDIAIFTNLSPEHIDSHGSYEKYRAEKAKLFQYISHKKAKVWRGKKIVPANIINIDDSEFSFYHAIHAPKKYTYGLKDGAQVHATHVLTTPHNVSFSVGPDRFDLQMPGTFMIPNALAAVTVALHLGIDSASTIKGIHAVDYIPGRMEEINTTLPFRVFVDYAHEKLSMRLLIENLKMMAQGGKVIVVFGAEGGGRDKGKRKEMADVVAQNADYAVVSDTDPYEEDPQMIVEEIGTYLEANNWKRDVQFFLISDRRQGIRKALILTTARDIVVCTAMGAQETMVTKNGTIPWSDREVIKEELVRLEK